MYAGLTETTKLNALYYFRRGKKGCGISLATPCGLGELMLGINSPSQIGRAHV